MNIYLPKKLSTFILIISLSLLSSWYVIDRVIWNNIDLRIEFESSILNGNSEPPYQYRILQPLLSKAFDSLLSAFILSGYWRHLIYSSFFILAIFTGVNLSFYAYLNIFFEETKAVAGLLLLQSLIPLSITGYYIEGDFLTFLLFIAGFLVIFANRPVFLLAIVLVGSFNREQIIFLILLYFFYAYSERKLNARNISILIGCVVIWLIIAFGLRWYYDFEPSKYTIGLHIERNTDLRILIRQIIPLWVAEVGGICVLCLLAFRKSHPFFKISFISMGLYACLFFLNGNLWELAKFFPVFIIMIPMGLQYFFDSYYPSSDAGKEHFAP